MRHQRNEEVPVIVRSFLLKLVKSTAPLAIAGLSLSLSVTSNAKADDQVRAVRVSNVVGTVQIVNGTETQFSQVYPNMPLMQGSTLKTGEDGRAEIQFEDGSLARLTPNTSLTLSVLSRTSEGNTNTAVDLKSGLSYIEMSGTANQRFVVHFLNNEVISPAPVKFRVNLDSNPPQFAVLDGSAHLSGSPDYALDVKANQTVRFDASNNGLRYVAQGVDGESWDQWNSDRDQAMSQMAARETREARGSSNPGDPSWNDLDYYGNWYSAGGTRFWSPYGAGPGWDPYGSGYWGYYGAGGGYTWISGYPWGWLPYHCGNWNYYNSFGWGWAPGGCGSVWSPVGGIGTSPAGYRPLPRPKFGGGPVRVPVNRVLIGVDRGTTATTLSPRPVAVARPVSVNGGTLQVLPKSPGTGTSSFTGRPVNTTVIRPTSGLGGLQSPGSSVPVYRPIAPPSGARTVSGFSGAHPVSGLSGARPMAPSSPSFGGGRPMGGAPVASPRFSAPSSAPAMAAPRMSAPAPSAGGHVR